MQHSHNPRRHMRVIMYLTYSCYMITNLLHCFAVYMVRVLTSSQRALDGTIAQHDSIDSTPLCSMTRLTQLNSTKEDDDDSQHFFSAIYL